MKRGIKILLSFFYLIYLKLKSILCRLLGVKLLKSYEVLMYHEVEDSQREKFSHQMDMLSQFSDPVSLDSLFEIENSSTHSVAVTFDDAYKCLERNVFPVLKEKNIPATIFVPTSYMGKQREWESKHESSANDKVLDRDSLISNVSLDITLGSHSVSHKDMVQLNEDERTDELRGSKKCLENITGSEVKYFAFPYGRFSEELITLCSQCGYKKSFGASPIGNSGHVIGRIDVSPDDFDLEFYLKIKGAYQWMIMVHKLKKYFNLW